jgi:DNA (cytosine-5)-methyltransferase 3A
MRVLSLFDGMSCGMLALERVGITPSKYYSSEIDKHAIKVSEDNYPDIIRLGDINNWKGWALDWKSIDLLIGGSPCQDFSHAKALGGGDNRVLGLKGDKSSLFYIYLDILNHIKTLNPNVKFLLENTKMKKDSEVQLNTYLGVKGVHINSNLVSFQSRPRIYWTNISVLEPPNDLGISFQDYKDTEYNYCSLFKVNKTPSRIRMWAEGKGTNTISSCANVTYSDKIRCLTTKQDRCPNSGLVAHDDFCRYLTKRELELAQTVPVGYTDCLSYNQASKVLGNGWTVDVISHILKDL